jgi:hypothetical protein
MAGIKRGRAALASLDAPSTAARSYRRKIQIRFSRTAATLVTRAGARKWAGRQRGAWRQWIGWRLYSHSRGIFGGPA